MSNESHHNNKQPVLKTIKAGFGYWDTTNYPIGGSFDRASRNGEGIGIVEILRNFKHYHGCNEEGITTDGRKVAYDTSNTILV